MLFRMERLSPLPLERFRGIDLVGRDVCQGSCKKMKVTLYYFQIHIAHIEYCTEMCKFMGKELRENAPTKREQEGAAGLMKYVNSSLPKSKSVAPRSADFLPS